MSVKIGDIVGVITVVEDVLWVFEGKPIPRFLVRCRCGDEFEMFESSIVEYQERVDGKRHSAYDPYVCRCSHDIAFWKHKEAQRTSAPAKGAPDSVNGLSRSPEHTVWRDLIQACHNPDHARYRANGKRGFTVCQRWRDSFLDFLADVGRKPTSKHRLLITPGHKTFNKESTRWVTPAEWHTFQSYSRYRTFDGVKKRSWDWAKALSQKNGLSPHVNLRRIVAGWSMEEILQSTSSGATNESAASLESVKS